MAKHENYEILNLIGYGLSKFNQSFINEFGFTNKSDFYKFCVISKIAQTTGTIKNRMDLFDPFFPNNGRKGWWQKGNAYIHRKVLIDSLFGNENVSDYANIIKLNLNKSLGKQNNNFEIKPIIKSRFKKLQETGLEAELYFMSNFNNINKFKDGKIDDARLYGDGYDFQITVGKDSYLAEIKGIRDKKGKFRMTQNEYTKAKEYKKNYILALVMNLNDSPKFLIVEDPINNLNFDEKIINSKSSLEYHLRDIIC